MGDDPTRGRFAGLLSGPIVKYYIFRVSRHANFSVPIFVLFYRARGLSLAQVGFLEGLFTVVVVLAETPTGYVGDRIGRRNSAVVGTFLSAVGALLFVFAHSFVVFAALIVVRAVAAAFKSGSIEAWLYDTLRAEGDEAEFARVGGRGETFGLVSHGVAAVVGGVLYAWNHNAPWVLEAVLVATGIAVLLSVPEPSRSDDGDGDGTDEAALDVAGAVAGVRDLLTQRATGLFVVYVAFLFAVAQTVAIFIQPVSVDVAGIPAQYLGLIYFGLAIIAAGAASQAGRINERLGVRGWFTVVPPLAGGALVLVVVEPLLALPIFFLFSGLSSVSNPLAGQYINDHIGSEGRATTLSAWSMIRSLFTSPVNVVGGALATSLLVSQAIGVLGAALLVVSVLVLLWRSPVVPGESAPSAGGT